MKPHLYKTEGYWVCAGAGRRGIATSPANAYLIWKKYYGETTDANRIYGGVHRSPAVVMAGYFD